jgi:rod shape-determining protein MreD
MKYVFLAIAVFLAFFLQGRISVLDIPPDLTVLLVFSIGLRYGETRGLLLGIVVGALEDSLSGSFIGPHMLSKGIVGFSAYFFTSGGLLRWTPVLGVIVVAVLTFADNVVVFLARTMFDKMPALLSTALFVSVMQSLLNAPAGIFIRPKHVD